MEIDRAAIIKRLEAMGIRFIPRRLLIGLVFLPIAIDHKLTWSTGSALIAHPTPERMVKHPAVLNAIGACKISFTGTIVGRPLLGDRPLTPTERSRKSRLNKKNKGKS
jgi:hypothetical protein